MKKILKYSKAKVLLSALLLLWVMVGSALGEARVTITKVDGSVEALILHQNNKLWFNDHSLCVTTYNNAQLTFPLSTVRKLTLESNVCIDGLDELMKDKEVISIFPNPSQDYFDLKFSGSDKANLRIYDTTGALVLQGDYESGSKVDVSKLHAGIFVVVVNNQSFKLIKQ